MAKMPPIGAMTNFHTKIMIPPAAIPAIAPYLLDLLQKRERSMHGPKVAPNPAQAKDTTLKTELSGFQARIKAISAMAITVPLATIIVFFWSRSMPKKSVSRSWDTLEDAARSWESAVDMVAARIPARITPAIKARIT